MVAKTPNAQSTLPHATPLSDLSGRGQHVVLKVGDASAGRIPNSNTLRVQCEKAAE